jgi:DNA sulfur modification protein DndD
MHLVRLSITNFGVYKGENNFDLSTNGGSIILFGGMNGSGKTTVLNSMRLCLYGAKALGPRITKKEYREYIDQQIHRNKFAKVPINSASVELAFNYGHLGSTDTFLVKRTWVRSNGKENIEEQLFIEQNKEMLDGIEEQHWQSFLDDLIPLSIFDLFFFDGEKISNLMVESLNSEVLSTEIKRLLGLDFIERLEDDLDTYLYQQRKNNVNKDEIKQLEAYEKARDEIEEQISFTKQERARLVSNMNLVSGKIDDLETKIHRESSGYALNRKKWQDRLTQIEIEKEQIKKQIHDLSANLLPFSLVPDLLIDLKVQLQLESRSQSWSASRAALEPKIDQIRETLSESDFWNKEINVEKEERNSITNNFLFLLDGLLDIPEEIQAVQIRHELSDSEKALLFSWIEQAIEEMPNLSDHLSKKFVKLDNEQKSVVLALRKIPSDEILQPYVDQLNILYQKLGNLKGQLTKIDEKIQMLDNQFSESKRLFVKAYLALRAEEKLEERLELVEKTQKVLEIYHNEQTRRKLHSLEELLVARFRELSHKEDFIAKVKIDEDDLSISLFDSQNILISTEQLSAGEQQMFAIALIWALRQLSGHPFPVVIDTPLGRLDSEHRERLVNQYFPHVSHQVILFSTDTEVDRAYFQELQPFISHSYHLDFDTIQGATTVREGYFWNKGALDAAY